MESPIAPIRSLLASGSPASALDQLIELTKPGGGDAHRSALLLRASLADLDQQVLRGLIDNEKAEQMRNRINFGALRLLDDLEAGSPTPGALLGDLQREFLSENTTAPQPPEIEYSKLFDGNIAADDGASVIIGQGNTVHKKVYTAWGSRQFGIVLVVLALIIAGVIYGGRWFGEKQDRAYASLKEIQAEMSALSGKNANLRANLEKNGGAIEALIAEGMQALKDKNYETAIRQLEQAAALAPAGTIYQNIGFAYEQMGNIEKARSNLQKAHEINPAIPLTKPYTALKGRRIDLLRLENGGRMLASSNANMAGLVDGNAIGFIPNNNAFAIFSFYDKRKATFDQLKYLVPSTNSSNFVHFELSWSDDSPTAGFKPIGKFSVQNLLLTEAPFQEVNFPPVTARFFKIQLTDQVPNGFAYEMQLMGVLE